MGEIFGYTWLIYLVLGLAFAAFAGVMFKPDASRVMVLLGVLPLLFSMTALLLAVDMFIAVPTMAFLALTILVCFVWGVRMIRHTEAGKKKLSLFLVGVIVCVLSLFVAAPVLLTQRQEAVLSRSFSTVMNETFSNLADMFRVINAERRK